MKETAVKLHLYFDGEHDREIVHDMIADMVTDYEEIYGIRVEYQIYEVEVRDELG